VSLSYLLFLHSLLFLGSCNDKCNSSGAKRSSGSCISTGRAGLCSRLFAHATVNFTDFCREKRGCNKSKVQVGKEEDTSLGDGVCATGRASAGSTRDAPWAAPWDRDHSSWGCTRQSGLATCRHHLVEENPLLHSQPHQNEQKREGEIAGQAWPGLRAEFLRQSGKIQDCHWQMPATHGCTDQARLPQARHWGKLLVFCGGFWR